MRGHIGHPERRLAPFRQRDAAQRGWRAADGRQPDDLQWLPAESEQLEAAAGLLRHDEPSCSSTAGGEEGAPHRLVELAWLAALGADLVHQLAAVREDLHAVGALARYEYLESVSTQPGRLSKSGRRVAAAAPGLMWRGDTDVFLPREAACVEYNDAVTRRVRHEQLAVCKDRVAQHRGSLGRRVTAIPMPVVGWAATAPQLSGAT